MQSHLDSLEFALNEAKKERDDYKFSFRNVSAENERLKSKIAELETSSE
jgi:hypothetical protein